MAIFVNKTALPGVTLAPLDLGSAIARRDDIRSVNDDVVSGLKSVSSITADRADTMVDIICLSAIRGGSNLSRDAIIGKLDSKSIFDVFFAVVNLSGFESCEQDESGESIGTT
jgi:hypothetical protein